MDRREIHDIIEAVLRSGGRTPGLLELPKAMKLRFALEACTSTREVVEVLRANAGTICKLFGLSSAAVDEGIRKIQALDVQSQS